VRHGPGAGAAGAGGGRNPELADFRRRFWWTLPLTVLVTLIAMSGDLFDGLLGAARPWVELW
jgi:Cu+-exporting ATPase